MIIALIFSLLIPNESANASVRQPNIDFARCAAADNSIEIYLTRVFVSRGFGAHIAVDYMEIRTQAGHWLTSNEGAPTQWINLKGEYAKITSKADGRFKLWTYGDSESPRIDVLIEVEAPQKWDGDISIQDAKTGAWKIPFTKIHCTRG